MLMPKTEALPKLLALGPLRKPALREITGWPDEELTKVIAQCREAKTVYAKSFNKHATAQLFFASKAAQ